MNITNRNFNTISPSAKSLLLMKGHTNIPYARQTAELLLYPNKFIPYFDNKNITFWARVLHFEKRYWSIDQLLTDQPIKNILELSSGFSFRGLETIKKNGFHYIDTDLPDVIAIKENIITSLSDSGFNTESKLELLPLNALDQIQFNERVNRFPEGEIAIVNEGLLMYLDAFEKEELCKIIHKILKERGGYWITADIYIKNQHNKPDLNIDPDTKKFFEQHQIEKNKFDSFEDARAFFKKMGFRIDKEADVKNSKLSSLKYFLKSTSIRQLFKIRRAGKIQATWLLRVASD